MNAKTNTVEFEKCSDRLLAKFPTYKFDNEHRVVPGPLTELENFSQMRSILLSTNLEVGSKFMA